MTKRIPWFLLGIFIGLMPSSAAGQNWSAVWKDPEVVNYELSMDKLRRLVSVQRDLNALSASQPDIPAKIDADMKVLQNKRPAPTLADAAGLLDQHTSVRNILAKNGLTSREWLLTSGAMSAAMIFMILEGRQTTGASPLSAAQKANVALLKQNQTEWKQIEEEFKRLGAEAASRTKR
jgi:hypothetical protein